jgi:SAM-dependent methyltransferase
VEIELKEVCPPEISFPRILGLRKYLSRPSITRSLMYEHLASLSLRGVILDFGGGAKAEYVNLLDVEEYESVNIVEGIEPTYIIPKQPPLPNLGKTFENILSMNTFEHLFDAEPYLLWLRDHLQEEGCIYIFVPFMYRIHGSPEDYTRLTATWWFKKLNLLGYKNIEITHSGVGPFTAMYNSGGYAITFGMKRTFILLCLCLDLIWQKLRKIKRKSFGEGQRMECFSCTFPLFYVIKAQRDETV